MEEDGVTKALCRIGAATTNEQFRRWCLDERGGDWAWTVPLNVIMVEITWGGSNAPICHGAGLRNRTLSDLVTEVEFVNARGELQTVSRPRAAEGGRRLLRPAGDRHVADAQARPDDVRDAPADEPAPAARDPSPPGFDVPAQST